MDEFEQALAELRAAGEGLTMATAGFVSATIRAVTAGRVATAPPDRPTFVAPDTPASLAEDSKGSDFYTVTWDAAASNDDYAIAGYRIYENGTPIAETTALEFTVTGRAPSTTYSVQVAAYTVGATSALSSAVSITTDASGGTAPTVDTTPPTDPGAVTVTAVSSTSMTVTWTASTDAGVGVNGYLVSLNGEPWDYVTSGTTTTLEFLQPGGVYTPTVKAFDNRGNASQAVAGAPVTLPGAPPEPAPPRTLSGAQATRPAESAGEIGVQDPPTVPGRALAGAATTGAATSAGSFGNAASEDLPPVWTLPDPGGTTINVAEGEAFSVTLAATDPEGNPITYSFASGSLPAGAAFDGVRTISGAAAAGTGLPGGQTYSSRWEASDEVAPPSITTASLPAGQTNVAYSTTLAATGGVAPYFWTATGLPAWATLGEATGTLSGTPTGQFGGTVTVTCRDSRSVQTVRQFTLTIAAPSSDDFDARMASAEGVLYATNFNRVYLGSGVGVAALTPGREINTTADLLTNYAGSGHTYGTGEFAYGQGGSAAGVQYPQGTPRVVLDKDTFGFNTLRLPGRRVDADQGGDWQQRINGRDSTLYRRLYVQFRIRMDRNAIAYRWNATDHKIFMLGSNQDGQVIISSGKNNGAIEMYYDVSRGIGDIPGTAIASNPWPRTVYRTYNVIDMGDTTLNASNKTAAEQAKWLENYGPLFRGYDWEYSYDATQPYYEDRPSLPRGYPDSAAFKNAPSWKYDEWITVQLFAERIVGQNLLSIQYWAAYDGQPFVELFRAIGNVPISGGSDTYFRIIQLLEYSTNRPSGTADDRNTWFRELVTSTKPIPGPGGFLPPNNQG